MSDPLTKTIIKLLRDPVDQIGITLPAAALVAIFFIHRHQIHPALRALPNPFDGGIDGTLVFIGFSLVLSLVLKRLSRGLLNKLYDHFYRDRRRRDADNWYRRAQTLALSTNDPLLSRYREALDRLRDNKNPVVAQVDALHLRAKLARSLSFVLAIFAVLLLYASLPLLALVCGLTTVSMLISFCKERWAASELVYQAVCETYYRQERRLPIWNSPNILLQSPTTIEKTTESAH